LFVQLSDLVEGLDIDERRNRLSGPGNQYSIAPVSHLVQQLPEVLALFSAASVWCGVSSNIQELIVARAVQGIGGALLVPGSLAIISASFAEDVRGKAIGTWSGHSLITTALGPLLGGYLIDHLS
jgi:MFS family permease